MSRKSAKKMALWVSADSTTPPTVSDQVAYITSLNPTHSVPETDVSAAQDDYADHERTYLQEIVRVADLESEVARLAQRIEGQIRAYWDGQSNVEPIHVLPGDQRALLLLRVGELSDMVAHHISAIIEGSDGKLHTSYSYFINKATDDEPKGKSIRYANFSKTGRSR